MLLLILASCSRQPAAIHFQGPIMGTQYELILACQTDKPSQALLQIALIEMEAINTAMSTYILDSELNQFNRSQLTDWQNVSPALLTVANIANEVSKLSNGAFDVTVSPLVDLWGFGPSETKRLDRTVPSNDALKSLLDTVVGYEKLEIDSVNQKWRKLDSNLRIDFSSIAKGYAVDKVSAALKAVDCYDHLIDIGGELKLSGRKNKKGDVWRVAIERPILSNTMTESIQKLLNLSDIGIASSGDYRNFYQVNGKRYSHMINPKTARPVEHDLAAVTVLHEETAVADAWATALMVLGDEAPIIAEKQNLAAYFIFREPKLEAIEDSKNAKKHRIISTKQFEKIVMSK